METLLQRVDRLYILHLLPLTSDLSQSFYKNMLFEKIFIFEEFSRSMNLTSAKYEKGFYLVGLKRLLCQHYL